jgi:hypothetical protein
MFQCVSRNVPEISLLTVRAGMPPIAHYGLLQLRSSAE